MSWTLRARSGRVLRLPRELLDQAGKTDGQARSEPSPQGGSGASDTPDGACSG
ncbi:hypothetical protein [Actinorugispora endophytica]|uniref:Uncharacterized protein n=1 Tax=Actinorugispora endophytica TaxID=1605990 RepID=A0A4R6UZP3_9ACTN|nr:hypothetical protein [Actinorugispora endophytica]TDQ53062.1 hypothetical protein EV190_105181 [Actinorugispora endophytica]